MATTPFRPSRRQFLHLTMGTSALGAAALTGCSPVSPSSSPGGSKGSKDFTIYWSAGHTYKAYEAVITQFGEEHGLNVNWQKFQWPDLETKLIADFRSGQVADLVEEQTAGGTLAHAATGHVLALDDLMAKNGIKASDFFVDNTVYQHEGKTFALPMHATANGLVFCNMDMLRKAGFAEPPATWEEFLEVAKACTQGNVKGYALSPLAEYSRNWLLQQGVSYSNLAEKLFLMPEEAAARTLQFLADLVHKHKVSAVPAATTDHTGPQKLFSAKRAAMIVSGPWDIKGVRKGSPDIDLKIAPPLKGSVQASSLAGAGLLIPAKAKDPELSFELAKRLISLETELAATKEAGMSMPRKSWAEAPEVANDPVMATIAQSLKVGRNIETDLVAAGKFGQVLDLYVKAYQEIAIQGANVTSTLAEFRREAAKAVA